MAWDRLRREFADYGHQDWSSDNPTWGIWEHPGVRGAHARRASDIDVIELGCGTAYVSAWLARRGAQAVGIDNSPRQLESARRFQTSSTCGSPSSRGMPSTPRSPTRRSTSRSRNTAPRSGAIPTPGSRRRRDCCGRADGLVFLGHSAARDDLFALRRRGHAPIEDRWSAISSGSSVRLVGRRSSRSPPQRDDPLLARCGFRDRGSAGAPSLRRALEPRIADWVTWSGAPVANRGGLEGPEADLRSSWKEVIPSLQLADPQPSLRVSRFGSRERHHVADLACTHLVPVALLFGTILIAPASASPHHHGASGRRRRSWGPKGGRPRGHAPEGRHHRARWQTRSRARSRRCPGGGDEVKGGDGIDLLRERRR